MTEKPNFLPSFTSSSADPITITGRGKGTLYGIEGGTYELPDGIWDPQHIKGDVEIDGVVRKVSGVEAFCVMRSPEHPYRLSFAIFVKDEDD